MPLSTYQYTFVIPQGMKTVIPITVYTTYPTTIKTLTGYTSTFAVKDMMSSLQIHHSAQKELGKRQ